MTPEDKSIIENLVFGSFALSEMGEIVEGDRRDAAVMMRHTERMARESVANNPMYPAQRVYWQARGFDRNGAPRAGEPAPF